MSSLHPDPTVQGRLCRLREETWEVSAYGESATRHHLSFWSPKLSVKSANQPRSSWDIMWLTTCFTKGVKRLGQLLREVDDVDSGDS